MREENGYIHTEIQKIWEHILLIFLMKQYNFFSKQCLSLAIICLKLKTYFIFV